MRLATLAIALLAGQSGAFDSTQTVSISGRDMAAIDGRGCA